MTTLNLPAALATRYTPNEVAQICGVSARTVSYWFRGRRGSAVDPVFALADQWDPQSMRLSFLDLCEVIVVANFRRHGASLQRIRLAREFTKQRVTSEHPFATEQFKLTGGRILWEFNEELPSNRKQDVLVDFDSSAGQYALPIYFAEALERFDYGDLLGDRAACRYHPYGRDVPLVIDPRFGSGRLTVTDFNIRAEAVLARFSHGYTVQEINDDLGVPVDLLKAVQLFQSAA